MCGPPGKGSPSSRATLSKASPAASSIVAPSGLTSLVTSSTSSSEECPPLTSSARHGSGSGPCSSWSTATWAARWLTPYSGVPSPSASALAAATPTSRAPTRPGPAVTETASTSDSRTPARSQARSTVGTIASRWAREATSGTTPPKRACSSTEEAMTSASSSLPRTSPTPVSSQEVSIPSTSGASALMGCPPGLQVALHHQRVAPVAVVGAPPVDLDEAEPTVERDRGLVARRDLQQHPAGRWRRR